MTRTAFITATFVAMMATTHELFAQTLAGRVSRGNTPITGALVVLIDAGGRTIAQTASRENGTYSVTAPGPGSYRAQVLQIGWRPTIAGPFALRAGVSTTANIDVTGARIPLDAIVINDHSDCRVRPDSAASAFILWDEARKALTAAMMTRAEPLTMSLSRTEQSLDRTGTRVLWDSTKVQVGQSLNPFFSLPPEVLAERGYMSADAENNKTYWGPDGTVMLSESFLSSHCIRPERPSAQAADSARLIGVAFAPDTKRRGVVDVEGVVWLDRSSAELREIVYHYVNTTTVIERADPGGRIEFMRIPGGRWIVHRWSIHVPSTVTSVRRGDVPTVPGATRVDKPVEDLSGIRLTSGQVSDIRRGSEVLWERGRVTLLVRIVDSATSRPIRGVLVRAAQSPSATASDSAGGVRMERIAPGPLTVRVESVDLELVGRSPILAAVDVPNASDATIEIPIPSARAIVLARCGDRVLDWGEGLLHGTVAPSPDRGPVIVSWQSPYTRLGGGDSVMLEEQREMIPTSDGTFDVCGIPRDATVSVRRKSDASSLVTSRFAPGALAARVSVR